MANRRYEQFFYTLHKKPIQVDCRFTVAVADSGGLGITGLTGAGVQAVYMHTSATAATGNPNPASGFIIVKFNDTYNAYYGGDFQVMSPASGSSILVASAGTVANTTYQITIVGTTTTAGWVTLGLPVGITPAVGVAFTATATTTAAGTGAVQVPATAGAAIALCDVIGNPNKTIASTAANIPGISSGAYMILRCLAATNSSTTTLIAAAPATGSIVTLKFLFSASNILVQGS